MNINEYCWVRLTPDGQTLDSNSEGESISNGWTRYQLWVLMNIFGPYLYNGCPQIFVQNEIRFTDPNENTKG